MTDKVVAVYSDGGIIEKNPSPIGGTYGFCYVGASGEVLWTGSGVIRPADVDLDEVSNNVSEFFALVQAFKGLPAKWAGTVYTDSKVTLSRFKNPRTCSFRGISDNLYTEFLAVMDRIGNQFNLVLLQGHPTQAELRAGVGKSGYPVSKFNVLADSLCNEAKLQISAS